MFAQDFNFRQGFFPQVMNYTPYTLIGVPMLMFVPISYRVEPVLISQDAGVPDNMPICNPITDEPWVFGAAPSFEELKEHDQQI